MQVLMFGWEFPPHISGGLGTACLGIATGLSANNVKVLFVVPKKHGNEDAGEIKVVGASDVEIPLPYAHTEKLQETFSYFEVNSPVVPYHSPETFAVSAQTSTVESKQTSHGPIMRYPFTGGYGKNLMKEVWQYALTAAAIATQHNFDVIHVHDWLAFPAGIMASAASGKPLVVHVHATEFDRSGSNINMQVYETERLGMLKADKVIAVSELTRKVIIDRYSIPPEKVVTIHNAVLPVAEEHKSLPSKPFKEKMITFAGRITYQKGPAYFIEAAAKILKVDKSFRFVMAGSGDMLKAMISYAAQLRISRYFHFPGFLKGAELEKLLAISDVFVMPSVSEPFGIIPLEAIRAGVPVIISRQSGVQEVLQYALKIDSPDTSDMANCIHALASYKGIHRLLKRESTQELNALNWEKQAYHIKKVYEHLTSTY
ncbi:glycosyltransferase family 4 protein [Chitinophaga ginsengisegetis]|uniref:glycosyltransferase family 4 protein n=1 Tax=Chitinophaga ginsengisegetis TaxID=393003 RepID=UPI00344A9E24